jgi:soluble lytic murein transglycosylase
MYMASFTLKQKAALIRDGLLVFGVSALATAAVATFSLSYLEQKGLTTLNPRVAIDEDPLEAIRVALGLPIQARATLQPVVAMQGSEIETQVAFVSAIIRSHVSDDTDTEELATMIVNESLRQDYDPIFVAAVIRTESRFKGSAVSYAGARGLMQIMPSTGRHISNEENVPWNGNATLHDAATNLRLGIAYLKQLEQKFKGNRERALIAYNWGPTNLDHSLRAGSRPPQECVRYARNIISAHRQWSESFGGLAFVKPEVKQVVG